MRRSWLLLPVVGCIVPPLPHDAEFTGPDEAPPTSSTSDTPVHPGPDDDPPGTGSCGRFSGRWSAESAASAAFSGAEGLGATVAVADLDGDDLDDVLIGSPGSDSVHGWLAPFTGDIGTTTASVRLVGEPGSGAGTSLAWVGDQTGDGFADLWVGAPGYDGGKGRLYFVAGPLVRDIDLATGIAIDGFEEDGRPSGIGQTLEAVGDLTGDGLPDLVVGGYAMAYTWILSGAPDGDGPITAAAAATLVPASPVGTGSSYAAGVGDIDGDDVEDLMVGAKGDVLGVGRAYLALGPLTGTIRLDTDADAVFPGGVDTEAFGVEVAGGHDATGDGIGDLWIGDVFGGDDDAGAVYLFDGSLRGEVGVDQASAVIRGEDRRDFAGMVVDPGDLDGDGHGDIVVGAAASQTSWATPDATGTLSIPGASYVLYGPFSGAISLATAAAGFGGAMPGGIAHRIDANTDGDGCSDLWLGAPTSSRAWLVRTSGQP